MATHSSILAWEIPRREEPGGGLHSMESQRDRTYQLNSNNNISESHSVVSDSLRPHGLYNPWNFLGHTGVGSLSLLQGIFPNQGLNSGLSYCRRNLYQLSHKGSPHSNSKSILITTQSCKIYEEKQIEQKGKQTNI